MDLILSDGYAVSLTTAAIGALRDAESLPDRPDVWRPATGAAEGPPDLIGQGLAERTPEGLLVLTPHGKEARARIRCVLGTAEETWDGVRVTVDPSLGEERIRILRRALAGVNPEALTTWTTGPEIPAHRHALLIVYAVALVAIMTTIASGIPFIPGVAFAVVAALAVGGSSMFQARARNRYAAWTPERITATFEGRYVSPRMLDAPARDLLRRAQESVDTVLGSVLHQEGLLLDTARNRVVLADVEWTLASGLVHQTRMRERIEATPVPGEQSRRAAERARAAVEEDTAKTEERVRVLEDYANRVRAAEQAEQDRRFAGELDAIAAEALEAGAVHQYQDEALESLVQAQELALRVAEMADPPADED